MSTSVTRATRFATTSVLLLGGMIFAQSFVSDVAAQTVYKTTDELGNVAYTDRPTSDMLVEAVEDLNIRYTSSVAMAEQNAAAAKQRQADNTARGIRRANEKEDAVTNAAANEKRAANCKLAQSRLSKYTDARRLYRSLPDGEREWLSDGEIDSERSKAAISVDEWCG
jgi:hypothetical protein